MDNIAKICPKIAKIMSDCNIEDRKVVDTQIRLWFFGCSFDENYLNLAKSRQ
jgi:hypothetical protein